MLRSLLFSNQTVRNYFFWSDVFKTWKKCFSKVKPNSTSQLLSEPVFCNKKLTQWVDNDTLAEFNTKFGVTFSMTFGVLIVVQV